MTHTSQPAGQPLEFIFGPLSTREGRLRQARLARLGFVHDSILEPADPGPGQPIRITARAGADIAVEAASLFYTTDGSPHTDAPGSASTRLPMQRTGLEWDTLGWCYLERWTAEIPGQPGGTQVQYLIRGTAPGGQAIYSPSYNTQAPAFVQSAADFDPKVARQLARQPSHQVYGFVVDEEPIPAWLHDAVIYQIFVDRFAPDPGADFARPADRSGFYGGTLKGITSRLDYLSQLGVTCLWLTPIFPSPSHHGYDPTDYGAVEPRLGTQEDLGELLEQAHWRGLRVLLDYVASHCSQRHPAFLSAQHDRSSPSSTWFRFTRWPDQYESYYDLPQQPKFNPDDAGARAYLIGNARDWLARGVDGFRLDHAQGMSHAFWSAFRAGTRAVRPDSVTLGEIVEPPDVVRSFAGRMDGCLDFTLLELLRGFFVTGSLAPSQFEQALRQHLAYFGAGLVLPSFLDNHDMNRFLWAVHGDRRRLRLAALCQFTLPGPPIIYYGTEVGLSQVRGVGRLEEARLPMRWGDEQDADLLAFYRALVALRRESPAAWRGERRALVVDDARGLLAYACGPPGLEAATGYAVALNNSPRAASVDLAIGRKVELLLASDAAASLSADPAQLHLPPYAGAACRIDSG